MKLIITLAVLLSKGGSYFFLFFYSLLKVDLLVYLLKCYGLQEIAIKKKPKWKKKKNYISTPPAPPNFTPLRRLNSRANVNFRDFFSFILFTLSSPSHTVYSSSVLFSRSFFFVNHFHPTTPAFSSFWREARVVFWSTRMPTMGVQGVARWGGEGGVGGFVYGAQKGTH